MFECAAIALVLVHPGADGGRDDGRFSERQRALMAVIK